MGPVNFSTCNDSLTALADIALLCFNQELADITFIVDNQPVHAHKVVLAARCAYFKSLLYGNSKDDVIVLVNISLAAFKHVLKYIYTGIIILPENVDLTVEILSYVQKISYHRLEETIVKSLTSETIKKVLCVKTVGTILNTANLYNLEELQNICHSFMDQNAAVILFKNGLNELTKNSMIKLLKRDTFFAPEIDIFEGVSKWCKHNDDVDKSVIQCVRLSCLTVSDIVCIVWPTKLVDCEVLLGAIAEINGNRPKLSQPRGLLVLNENIAAWFKYNAVVISGSNPDHVLKGNRDLTKDVFHPIDGKSNITVKLGSVAYFNHIQMGLWDGDYRSYSYYIEVSVDEKDWRKIIDYSSFSCRSVQNLHFEPQVAQYIKVVGTHNTANARFHMIYFEAYFEESVPIVINGIICPEINVATTVAKAVVIKGLEPQSLLLDEYTVNYKQLTYHKIGSDPIVVQLAQPFMISSMRLLLCNKDDRSYRYFIETSVDNKNWQVAVDRRNEHCKSWQDVSFEGRPVVFIKITGIYNSDAFNNLFEIVHFECPSQG